jgi:geranyl-CoA carboxylase alpha subunit
MTTAFHTILIANRGEIAARILRSAARMGYRTVAVYSDADAALPYLREADSAVRLGPAQAAASYLNGAAILAAARASGADAIHPGYGFLAENPDFAQAVQEAGLVWIGPSPAAMRAMGNKASAKRMLQDYPVPMLSGYQGQQQDLAHLEREAARIGLPLMIKAAAGGGGRGMRLVLQFDDIAPSLARARSESTQAFGSGELILERALLAPRHVEVQIFADQCGNVVHLGERDCSVQRRHQKLIEETPSPVVSPALRAELGAAAMAVARCCDYAGAGTVEFLLEPDGAFWFMEMNTRLQVEHTVTEAITGLDLVEWQLRVAAGEALPLAQAAIDARLAAGGHAIEVRLCAEDPAQDFLPQAGRIGVWRTAPQLRTEHALVSGLTISPYYDSMLAKLIAHGDDREAARRKLVQGLAHCSLLGLATNQDFLADCLQHPVFAAGQATTGFIASHFPPEQLRAGPPLSVGTLAQAAALLLALAVRKLARPYPAELAGWCSSGSLETALAFALDGVSASVTAVSIASGAGAQAWSLSGGAGALIFADMMCSIDACTANDLCLTLAGSAQRIVFSQEAEAISWRHAGRTHRLRDLTNTRSQAQGGQAGDGRLRAPMNGRVVALHVQLGQTVQAGQPLVVLEAMKMEHTLLAPCAGQVHLLHATLGQQVAPGTGLLEITSIPT